MSCVCMCVCVCLHSNCSLTVGASETSQTKTWHFYFSQVVHTWGKIHGCTESEPSVASILHPQKIHVAGQLGKARKAAINSPHLV